MKSIIVHIENFIMCRMAELVIRGITILSGDNYHGKSSVALAVSSALSDEIMPYGLPKNQASLLVNRAAKSALVTVGNGDGSATVQFPKCSKSSIGTPPSADAVSLGTVSPVDMTPKEFARYLSELLSLEPTEKQLRDAAASTGLDDEGFKRLWTLVTRSGWDAAYQQAKDRGAELKGQWRQVTGGETWGAGKVDSWHPADWTPALEHARLEDLQAQVAVLEAEHVEAIGRRAVDNTEIERCAAEAAKYDDAMREYEDIERKTLAAFEKLTALRKKPAPERLSRDDGQPCPYCGESVSVNNGKVVKSSTVTDADVKKSAKAWEKHRSELTTEESDYTLLVAQRDAADIIVKRCVAAKERLSKLQAVPDAPPTRTVDEINEDLTVLHLKINAIRTNAEARSIHERIVKNDVIVKALAEDGVRKTAMTAGLSKFNGHMSTLSAIAHWKPIVVTEDLDIEYGGSPFVLCSASEKFRIRVLFQVWHAVEHKADIMVIDGADILDRNGRRGLVALLTSAGIPTLICSTANAPEDIRDPGKIGNAYWIENGETRPLYEMVTDKEGGCRIMSAKK